LLIGKKKFIIVDINAENNNPKITINGKSFITLPLPK